MLAGGDRSLPLLNPDCCLRAQEMSQPNPWTPVGTCGMVPAVGPGVETGMRGEKNLGGMAAAAPAFPKNSCKAVQVF